ncbi:hypothetical protein RCH21_002513 [Arthrobacter sp. PL16]|uniref:hypothetical protein n=1 Tax=Arthrobacter sp. PL16 TaxID=3071720 RepID=UPI002DFE79AA|nr:hypothetical protein [Arthrobacter sp. PL16]
MNIENDENAERTSILEAVAIVELIIHDERDGGAAVMLTESEDPVRLARSACGLAAALLMRLAPGHEDEILDRYRRAFFDEVTGSS